MFPTVFSIHLQQETLNFFYKTYSQSSPSCKKYLSFNKIENINDPCLFFALLISYCVCYYPSECEDKVSIAEPWALKIRFHSLEFMKSRSCQLTFMQSALWYIICSISCIIIQWLQLQWWIFIQTIFSDMTFAYMTKVRICLDSFIIDSLTPIANEIRLITWLLFEMSCRESA